MYTLLSPTWHTASVATGQPGVWRHCLWMEGCCHHYAHILTHIKTHTLTPCVWWQDGTVVNTIIPGLEEQGSSPGCDLASRPVNLSLYPQVPTMSIKYGDLCRTSLTLPRVVCILWTCGYEVEFASFFQVRNSKGSQCHSHHNTAF